MFYGQQLGHWSIEAAAAAVQKNPLSLCNFLLSSAQPGHNLATAIGVQNCAHAHPFISEHSENVFVRLVASYSCLQDSTIGRVNGTEPDAWRPKIVEECLLCALL